MIRKRASQFNRRLSMESLEERRVLATYVAFGSIQDAVDLAADNPGPDLVYVPAGRYTENVVINDGDPVALYGVAAKINGNGQDAISIFDSADVKIVGLTVYNGFDGINADNVGRLNLQYVHAKDNTDDGIELFQVAHAKLDYVQANNNGWGMYWNNVQNASLFGVTAKHNDNDGLNVDTVETLTVNSSVFDHNGDDGLFAENIATAKLTALITKHNGLDGVRVDSSDTVHIASSLSRDNGEDGFEVDARNTKATHLTAIHNGEDGLDVDDFSGDDSVQVLGGNYSYNGADGLDLDDMENVEVSQVLATYNELRGIHIDDSEHIDVSFSYATANKGDGILIDSDQLVDDVRLWGVFSYLNKGNGLTASNIDNLTVFGYFYLNEGNGIRTDNVAAFNRTLAFAWANGDKDIEEL